MHARIEAQRREFRARERYRSEQYNSADNCSFNLTVYH
jgi:hypothetical protein